MATVAVRVQEKAVQVESLETFARQDEPKDPAIDAQITKLFQRLTKEPQILNEIVRGKIGDKEITVIDYMGAVEEIFPDFIQQFGFQSLKGFQEYVIKEIFDNSCLGDILFNKLLLGV